MAIEQAVAELKAKGEKVTQAAVAKIVGVTQGFISRFRKLLQTLLDDSYSKSNTYHYWLKSQPKRYSRGC